VKYSRELDRRVYVTAAKSLPNFPRREEAEDDNQVAAPTESRTPHWHRAQNRSHKSADGRVATEAAWLHLKGRSTKEKTVSFFGFWVSRGVEVPIMVVFRGAIGGFVAMGKRLMLAVDSLNSQLRRTYKTGHFFGESVSQPSH
jgi:hypothetical protein